MRKLAPARVSYFLISYRVLNTSWLSHFISRYLKVHFMLIKYTCDSKSQTKRMRHPFQSTSKPISHRNGWSFRVYMISLRDNEILAPEWSRTGAKVAQVSCKHPLRKFGYLCIQEISALTKSYVRRYVRRSTPSCKPGWNFLLQATARFGGKLHDYQNFPKQKTATKPSLFD